MKTIAIGLVCRSVILIEGISSILSDIREVNIDLTDLSMDEIASWHRDEDKGVVIIDPVYSGVDAIAKLCHGHRKKLKIIVLGNITLPEDIIKEADAVINIYDSRNVIETTLRRCLVATKDDDEQPELTAREKDIVIGIVKGQSNKEIANALNVSVNTVMTHRRNIAAKLQIHSPAGLTIYAIVSKLVDIDDVKVM